MVPVQQAWAAWVVWAVCTNRQTKQISNEYIQRAVNNRSFCYREEL